MEIIRSASYMKSEVKDGKVRQAMDNLLKNRKENAFIYPAPKGDLIKWFEKLQEELGIKSYVKFSMPQKFLSQSCYKIGSNWLFFIANTSLSEQILVNAEFQVEKDLYPWLWNPEAGEKKRYPTVKKNNTIELVLPKATSRLILFEKEAQGKLYEVQKTTKNEEEISGPWQLQLNPINGNNNQIEIDSLMDLIDLEETKNFAGTIIYKKIITINDENIPCYVDLGNVQGITELSLNGKQLGTRWYGAHIYNINNTIKPGENELSVKLITIAGNYMKSLKDNPVAQIWTKNQPYHSMGILGPIKIIFEGNLG